ncbi:hypothetical protein [uncultured Thiodictyon sp.]|uniref:hypothetical protein n=1 Tax=uncultured Thiodictyon sp. TaxID=1846217 RepID=UPI0025CCFCEF|nr:hypothetical protein [uncultured Thiodictyon sp.]
MQHRVQTVGCKDAVEPTHQSIRVRVGDALANRLARGAELEVDQAQEDSGLALPPASLDALFNALLDTLRDTLLSALLDLAVDS